jgi:hypothetical protein
MQVHPFSRQSFLRTALTSGRLAYRKIAVMMMTVSTPSAKAVTI